MSGKGLGKGLEALLGNAAADMDSVYNAQKLDISKIEPRADQPRKRFEDDSLQSLSESIAQDGVLQPLTVRLVQEGYYQIISGERRWRAARKAGLTEVPVIIIEADDKKAMELALIENLQREDLNPIEEAEGFKKLLEDYGLTQEELSKRVGTSRPAIANAVRLLALPEKIRHMLEEGALTGGHARALMQIKDERTLLAAAERVAEERLSVRQTELLAKRLGAEPRMKKQAQGVDYIAPIEERLSSCLGRRVKVTYGEKKGKIELEYYGNDDFEALLSSLEALTIKK